MLAAGMRAASQAPRAETAFLFARGSIVLGRDWAMLVFPMLLLLLIWAKGQHAARRRENNRMKARDIA